MMLEGIEAGVSAAELMARHNNSTVHGFICGHCGDVCDGQPTEIRAHLCTNNGGEFSVSLCYECAGVPLCPASPSGQHGQVIDADELIEDAKGYPHDPLVWFKMPNWLRSRPNNTKGICVGCQHWMIWSTRDQRWEEPEDNG